MRTPSYLNDLGDLHPMELGPQQITQRGKELVGDQLDQPCSRLTLLTSPHLIILQGQVGKYRRSYRVPLT